METNTHSRAATLQGTRSHRVAQLLLSDRHPVALSIALHLIPGILIVAAFLLIAEPIVQSINYPGFLGWAIAMVIGLAPFELGLLLWLGYQRNGRLSLRGVVKFLDRPLSRGRLIGTVAPLIVWMVAVAFSLTSFDALVYRAFFEWVPFQGAGGSPTAAIDGFAPSVVITSLAIALPLTGVTLPLIEELYFRGFLLPRLNLGRWAPVLNTTLFSVYHLWSPWSVLSRIVFFLPAVWLVWRKQDLRISIGMHVGATFLTQAVSMLGFALIVAR